MQIFDSKKIFENLCDMRTERADISVFRNIYLNVHQNFALACLSSVDSRDYAGSKFYNKKAFFLEFSTDSKIESISAFIFSLQAPDIGKTFLSWFYEKEQEELALDLTNKSATPEDHVFMFDWFGNKRLMPCHPNYRDKISDSFFYLGGQFFDYQVFDVCDNSTSRNILKAFSCGSSIIGNPEKRIKKVMRRSRFFKKKYL